jgi:hypothetical protein
MVLLAYRLLAVATILFISADVSAKTNFDRFSWTEINDGSGVVWEPRAGLQAVKLGSRFLVLGGRAPKPEPLTFGDSFFFNDVWESVDYGENWQRLTDGVGAPWAARAYFQAVRKGGHVYVLGGQDSIAIENPACAFLPPEQPCIPQYVLASTFFNDVWRSADGENWELMTEDAAWSGRAGLSAVSLGKYIYVMGGSVNDDSAIIGPGGPPRIYFNDVYRSQDGQHWEQVTDAAPWAPRAGAVLVRRGKFMYLLGGEDGFVCNDDTPRCPPYFNDVWRSRDGLHWQQMTADAGWSPRPGHQCEVLLGRIVCFGGFGLSPDPDQPFLPANPTDVWVSGNGVKWREVRGSGAPPWNAEGPEDIRYDFAAFVKYWVNGRFQPSIFTFGGDLETFNPFDPTAFLKVENDTWQFAPPTREKPALRGF